MNEQLSSHKFVISSVPFYISFDYTINILIVMSNMVTSTIVIARKIAKATLLRRNTQFAILNSDVSLRPAFSSQHAIARWYSRNRIFCFTIWASISPFPSLQPSLVHSISPFRTSSLFSFSFSRDERGEARDRSGLAGSPDTFIGGYSTCKADRPTRAGGSKAPAASGRSRTRVVSTGSLNSRAHHSKVLATKREGGLVLSRGSSVSVWKRPRTPVRAVAAYASRSFRP